MSYLIGIDCGGTHIVGQVWSNYDKQLIKQVTGGPGNIVFDHDGTITNLTQVLDQLTSTYKKSDISMILVGIAGIETANAKEEVTALLNSRYGITIEIVSDAKLALLNGLKGEDGALIISGTGSVIYGRQKKQFLRAGGWGYILGDQGSAYDISKCALRTILNKTDNGEKPSKLAQVLFAHFQTTDVTTTVAKFYTQDRKTNAQAALVIAELAENGNDEARQILTNSSIALAKQAITLINRFTVPKPLTAALSGSVLQHNELIRTTLMNTIYSTYPEIKFTDITTNNAHAVLYWHKWAR